MAAGDLPCNAMTTETSKALEVVFTLLLDGGTRVTHTYDLSGEQSVGDEMALGVTKMLVKSLGGKGGLVFLEHPVAVYRSDRLLGFDINVKGSGDLADTALELEKKLSFVRS